MNLFEHQRKERLAHDAPLATRMRPRVFEGVLGQEHLLSQDSVLRRAIELDQVPSMILWGPPGTGKTTIALVIAHYTSSHFEQLSAVASGVSDIRRVIEEARERAGMYDRHTIVFVDEIHRFNKAQQEVILPHVEDGTITFIGATTENPSFGIVSPLLSRCRLLPLRLLTEGNMRALIERACVDVDQGLGARNVQFEPEALAFLVDTAAGDARFALNTLELASAATEPDEHGRQVLTLNILESAVQQRALMYDKHGDHHYDSISALIKSVRGSDPDAAIYWLARILEAGEDPLFIARRLMILSAEDIGLAEPQALSIAVACQQAVHFLGLPEAAIPLAETIIYLATAPKSNSAYTAFLAAQRDARVTGNDPVPLHIRNAATGIMGAMNHGVGYKYVHDYEGNFVAQEYLPESVRGQRYYTPGGEGRESEIERRLNLWWGDRAERKPE